ncbi:MAG: hypothetical protein GXP55_19105 [Deltaproteobacteria bacterium]|nr:hypothetical protein [Deltaproteobacteria bacterium]
MRGATTIRRTTRLAWTLTLVALCAAQSGCGDAAAQDIIEVRAADLPCADAAPEADGSWQTAPLPPLPTGCSWLPFTGRRTYVFDHPLGRTPRDVEVFVSFDQSGTPASLGAGDEALIEGADASSFSLRNGTRQDFFVRVILR